MQEDAQAANGCIIDQRRLADMPFGLSTSDRNGCAWIAAYNAHILLGVPQQSKKVVRQLKRYLLFGGLNGTPFYALYFYFRAKGFRATLHLEKKQFDRRARHSSVGILLYFHSRGGHYVCFEPLKNGTYRFYNDRYGEEKDVRTMSQFLKDHKSHLPMLLLSIGR